MCPKCNGKIGVWPGNLSELRQYTRTCKQCGTRVRMANSITMSALIIALAIPFLMINVSLILTTPFMQTIGGILVLIALAVTCHKVVNKYSKWKMIEKNPPNKSL